MKSSPSLPCRRSKPGATGDDVVVRAALQDVVAEGVGQDVVTDAADDVVVAGAGLDDVVATVAVDRVVTLTGGCDRRPQSMRSGRVVLDVGAVPDRVQATEIPDRAVDELTSRSAGRFEVRAGHLCLVAVGERIVRTELGSTRNVHVEHAVRAEEHDCRQTVGGRVAPDQLGERVAFELRQQVQAVEPLQVVEAVGVLQVLQLRSRRRR